MGWVIAVIVFILLYLALQYWYVTLGLVLVGLVVYSIRKANEEERQREAAEARQKALEAAALQRRIEEQKGRLAQMNAIGEGSLNIFENLPKPLSSAERFLNRAEFDFSDGAFAPFWDSIERAARNLALFYEGIGLIHKNWSRFNELSKGYEDTPPEFPLSRQSICKLGVGTSTAERMKSIVRNAQRNFQFASIYEQRQTNKILIDGFADLADALDRLASRISNSIDELSTSMNSMSFALEERADAANSQLIEIARIGQHHHEATFKDASDSAARQTKALEMLDNVQRQRKPFP